MHIVERLEKLERQNRRMKRAGMSILVLASALLMMGQARWNRTVEANAFVLRDTSGKVRAALWLVSDEPILTLADKKGSSLVKLALGTMEGTKMSVLSLSNPEAPSTGLHVFVTKDGPHMELTDEAGFAADIGVTGLETPSTGESSKTSAASVVLFGKDKKVLWKAP